MHQIVKVYQASNVVLYVNYYFNITILPISTVRVKNEENLHTGLKYFLAKSLPRKYRAFIFHFADINECSEGTDDCSINAMCLNTNGSFTCACHMGYIGNGSNCTGKFMNISLRNKKKLIIIRQKQEEVKISTITRQGDKVKWNCLFPKI